MGADKDVDAQPSLLTVPHDKRRERQHVASVLVDIDVPHLDHSLEYSIPSDLKDHIKVGQLVRVALAGRERNAWILSCSQSSRFTGNLSPILDVISQVPIVTPSILRLAQYIAHRQLATTSQVLSLAIPQRRVRVEKRFIKSYTKKDDRSTTEDGLTKSGTTEESTSWHMYEGGVELLHSLTSDLTRSVWTALPHVWLKNLNDLVIAALSGNSDSVLIIMPTASQVHGLSKILQARWGMDQVVTVTSEDSPSDKYAVHLDAIAGKTTIVIGTRSAVWTPMERHGLIVIWDDGDNRLIERRSPQVGALDVAVARSRLEGHSLLVASFSRSVKAESLVAWNWATSVEPIRASKHATCAQVRVIDETDREREGASGHARIPLLAQRAIRSWLEHGPVLIQVPLSGYIVSIVCITCGKVARCRYCEGNLSQDDSGRIRCTWCGRNVVAFLCSHCQGTRMRSMRVGSQRTGEELGRAFPGVPLTISNGALSVTRHIGQESRLVVATPGAEPQAEGGYAGALITDVSAIAGRSELWAYEEAMRRWMAALALVSPRHPAMVLGPLDSSLGQTLIRWDSPRLARDLLEERRQLGFFPFSTIVALDGQSHHVSEVLAELPDFVEVMGMVQHEERPSKRPLTDDLFLDEGFFHGDQMRCLLRVPPSQTDDLIDVLQNIRQRRSSRRRPAVRMKVNPPELF